VEIDANGYAVTFNLLTGKVTRHSFDVEGGESLVALACASTRQCTAVDNDGAMLTFKPTGGKDIAVASIDAVVGLDAPSGDSSNELDGIACPTRTLCDAVDSQGDEVSFNPRSRRTVKSTLLDPGQGFSSVSCPSAHECVAVDSAGRAFVGDPHSKHWTAEPIAGAVALTGVACFSTKVCAAVDQAGDAFVGRG
jgi:hypothetical protein